MPKASSLLHEVNAARKSTDGLEHMPDHIKYSRTGGVIVNNLTLPTKATKPVKFQASTIRASAAVVLPETFDWRDKLDANGVPLLTPIQDQGACGSCYAFASTDHLANRISIQSKGAVRPILATQDIINCGSAFVQNVLSNPSVFAEYGIAVAGEYGLDGCDGGLLTSAVDYLVVKGAPLLSSTPYTSYNGTPPSANACSTTSSTSQRAWATDAYAVVAGGEDDGFDSGAVMSAQKIALNVQNMKTDIYLHGPVVAGMLAYDDFLVYPANGIVYEPENTFTVNGKVYKNKLDGGHAVQIVGWTNVADANGKMTPVWIIKNQWTESWGINGYGYIPLGNNVVSIEQDVLANSPLMTVDSTGAAVLATPSFASKETSNSNLKHVDNVATTSAGSSSSYIAKHKTYIMAVIVISVVIAGILIASKLKKHKAYAKLSM